MSKAGGTAGIPPRQVADELLMALEADQLDVPVGQTKQVYPLFQEVYSRLYSK